GAPVAVPTCGEQYGATLDVDLVEQAGPDLHTVRLEAQTGEVCGLLQGETGQIEPLGETVEGCVEVGAGVGDQVGSTDLELGPLRVVIARVSAAQVVGDDGTWQAGIGDRP